jgi:hypothetical protein
VFEASNRADPPAGDARSGAPLLQALAGRRRRVGSARRREPRAVPSGRTSDRELQGVVPRDRRGSGRGAVSGRDALGHQALLRCVLRDVAAPPKGGASPRPAPRAQGECQSLEGASSPVRTVDTSGTATSSRPATSPDEPAEPRAAPCSSRTVAPALRRHGVTDAAISWTSVRPAWHRAAPDPGGVARRRTDPSSPSQVSSSRHPRHPTRITQPPPRWRRLFEGALGDCSRRSPNVAL